MGNLATGGVGGCVDLCVGTCIERTRREAKAGGGVAPFSRPRRGTFPPIRAIMLNLAPFAPLQRCSAAILRRFYVICGSISHARARCCRQCVAAWFDCQDLALRGGDHLAASFFLLGAFAPDTRVM